MKRSPQRALLERNATACETARHPTCHCACGGALHGQRHSELWRAEMWRKLNPEPLDQTQLLLDGMMTDGHEHLSDLRRT